ncbi:hypothetical protein [Streptomyces sp. NPDC001020]
MTSGRPISGASPETVLTGGGTTARFNGSQLRIVRGRTTWTLPVRALASAELTTSGAVWIEINGTPNQAEHGLGQAVELRAPNAHAAEAFLAQLTAALAATEPAADGHALVQVERKTKQSPWQGALGRRAKAIVFLLAPYVLLLLLLGWVSPLDGAEAGVSLGVGGALGLAGGFTLWRVGRRAHSLWLLRKRGIGVVGKVTGYVKIWDKGVHYWQFSKMKFTTVDGQHMWDVPSVVTTWAFSKHADTGQSVELNYDPERPNRASRPLTIGFVLRTLLLAAVGAVPATGFATCILANLPS